MPNTTSFRQLPVYAFDPSQGKRLGNFMRVAVRRENVGPGPTSDRFAVIDYDATHDCFYEPVDLNNPEILLAGGLAPTEADPRFHQQMVYAVASETLQTFEIALGRQVKWAFPSKSAAEGERERRLRIYPHAFQEANAYYDREQRALLFGYFTTTALTSNGLAHSDRTFTCLSHDIVAHETTHALIDSQRSYFSEPTGLDTLAFHEGFADLVALFQHFTFADALVETIQRTGGELHRLALAPEAAGGGNGATIVLQSQYSESNPMVDLAKQFGEAMGRRAALRSALGSPPNGEDLGKLTEPHDRGAILVAAVFDAFFTSFVRRTRDLFRIARAGGLPLTAGDLHPDLANRLAGEASATAASFCTMIIRALDYCPPVDITFGDFLRAMITADSEVHPDDPIGCRDALIRSFRARGIRASGAVSFSEDSLRWQAPPLDPGKKAPHAPRLDFQVMQQNDSLQQQKNAIALHKFATEHHHYLGLAPNAKVRVTHFHPIARTTPEGHRFEVVVEYVQSRSVPLDPNAPNGQKFMFRGGSTVILNSDGTVRFSIGKNINDERRLQRQREYYGKYNLALAELTYEARHEDEYREDRHDRRQLERKVNFRRLHRGW